MQSSDSALHALASISNSHHNSDSFAATRRSLFNLIYFVPSHSVNQSVNQSIMPFTLHPVTLDDASDITAIFHAAFADDHIMSYLHPHVPAPVIWQRDLKYYQDLIAQGNVYGERLTKAVDAESG